ncbi:MAG: PEP/pyruvate-binding domain-containing protein, partial [Anaerolineae bacterium]
MYIVRWLEEITSEDRALVGGKAFNLAQIAQAGFPVPAGFCITTTAYQDFVAINALEKYIQALAHLSPAQVQITARELQQRIRSGCLGDAVRETILSAYHRLTANERQQPIPVAVRSSASAEDMPSASFAGQGATLLNVR